MFSLWEDVWQGEGGQCPWLPPASHDPPASREPPRPSHPWLNPEALIPPLTGTLPPLRAKTNYI